MTTSLDKLRDKVERKRLRLQLRLLETQYNVYDNLVDPREQLYDTPDFWAPIGYAEAVPPNLDNAKRGEVLPVYLTELGLKRLRDESRRLLAYNEYAINAAENRISYLVGKGFEYKAVRRGSTSRAGGSGTPDPLATAVQWVVDRFHADNLWGELEQEVWRRLDRDGEAFLRFFAVGNGRCQARVIEPEWVKSPSGDSNSPSNFGIECDPDDVQDVTGYWVVEDPARSPEVKFVPADEILHIKLNVDRNARRGLPTFTPVRKNLDRAEKLLKNMSVLAQVQATFALIRKHRSASAAAVAAWQANDADGSIANPFGNGQSLYHKQYQPGSIIDADADTEYEFPASTVRSAEYVQILQAELRAVASRLCMPEYMLTADASNANFASTMVAESPFVKHAERLQSFYSRCMGHGSYPGDAARAGGVWRAIKTAVDDGVLPSEALTDIELQVQGASLTVRDKNQETERSERLNKNGVLSRTTWAQQESLDYDQERKLIEKEGPPPGQQQQQSPFSGGDPFGLTEGRQEDSDLGDPGERSALIAEILAATHGDVALQALSDDVQESVLLEAWDALSHPRGPDGRFIPKASPEAVASAKDKIKAALKGEKTPQSAKILADHLSILTTKQLRDLKKEYGLKASGKTFEQLRDKIASQLDANRSQKGETSGRNRPDGGKVAKDRRQVAGTTVGPGDTGAGEVGKDGSQSTGAKAHARVPAEIHEVNKRLDRYSELFRAKGQHQIADWMGMLREHVNSVGVDAALDSLGSVVHGKGENVQYGGHAIDAGDFAEHYLNRSGISLVHGSPGDDMKIVSTVAPSSDDEGIKSRGRDTDVFPTLQTLKNKLHEAKHLPGLEKSEDLGELMGKQFGERVTQFTPEVWKKLDETYGEGKWIVKSYGDEAYAGYGIFFPQRAKQIQLDAKNTIWDAGSHVAKYGFQLRRDESGKVVGLEHQGGDRYDFGTEKYNATIHGDARHWGDKAASAAASEHGAALPEGSFMAQPAFPVVGVSNEERAAGVTFKKGQEGRVHIVTRNGKAEIVPHSTWLKEEHLPVVFESDDTKAMAQAAVDAINALPESERNGQLYAPDIVKTADGYKVVEANPANEAGASGYLQDNPFIIDSYVSHITGREPTHVSFIRKLLSKRR